MRLPVAAIALLSALSLTSCAKDEYLYIDNGWVNLPAVNGNPGAAYFTIHGGPQADTLIGVSSPVAIRSEMHDMSNDGGVMKMRPIKSVPVPAKGTVEFAPGGMHVMLFDLRPNFKTGDKIRLDFTFASGEQVYIEAPAQAAGGGSPHEKH